jgi:hypothetical protein
MRISLRPYAKNKPMIFSAILFFLSLSWKLIDAVSNIDFIFQTLGLQESVANFLARRGPDVAVILTLGVLVLSLLFQPSSDEQKAKPPATARAKAQERLATPAVVKETCPYQWTHNIAEAERSSIQNAVLIKGCKIHYELADQLPYTDFTFTVFNGSVYAISTNTAVDGYISFRKRRLMGNIQTERSLKNLSHASEGTFVIRLQLSREEAEVISNANDPDNDVFYFHQLRVKVNGGDFYPDVETVSLKLPDTVQMDNSEKRIKILNAQHQFEKEQLEKQHREEIDLLKSQLDKLTAYKLTFEVDVPRSQIHVDGHPYEDFNVNLNLYIRFENSDIYPLIVRGVNVLLMKTNEDKTASAIPLTKQMLYTTLVENDRAVQRGWESRNLSVNGRELTLSHTIDGYLSVSGDYREILDSSCFLRITMDAMNQPLYSLDFNVKWQNINLGWIGITPRT